MSKNKYNLQSSEARVVLRALAKAERYVDVMLSEGQLTDAEAAMEVADYKQVFEVVFKQAPSHLRSALLASGRDVLKKG